MRSFQLLLVATLLLLNPAPDALASEHVAPHPESLTAPSLCWQSGGADCTPEFEEYFPDDPAGAGALAAFWNAPARPEYSADTVVALARQGLRRFEGDRAALLRWIGRKYITGAAPHPGAVELMFHAAGELGWQRPAVFFGLSPLDSKPPAVLRALVDIAMATDDPDLLSRIAWGVGEQRGEAESFLAPYRESASAATREKARVVAAILARELKAFDWAMERRRQDLRRQFGHELPRMAGELAAGDSEQRHQLLDRIAREELTLIMEEPFLQAFRACAQDADADVRRKVATMVGQRWIAAAREPAPRAVGLLLDLSLDVDRETRYNAVYHGLSAIRVKEKAVIRRLVEIAFEERDPELYQRIAWGLRGQRRETRAMLDSYVNGDTPRWAEAAQEVYADLAG